MMRPSQIPPQIAVLCDSPIAFHRALVAPAGGALGALFLSQALYWTKRTSDSDGWFWKTQDEWEYETGMTRSEQETARRNLRAAGILGEKREGLPARLHYRVDLNQLAAVMANCDAIKYAEIPQTRCGKSRRLDAANPADYITETTTETTAENLPQPPQGARGNDPILSEPIIGPSPPKLCNRFFEALEESYLVRTVRGDEWLQVQEQFERWEKRGYPIRLAWFRDACVDARAACKAATGRFPFTVTPLINHLAELIGEMEPRSNG